jgi:hypothetical protein
MAESHAADRFVLSLLAVASTLGGWFVLALRDAPPVAAPHVLNEPPLLPPRPALEPAPERRPVPVRRPTPMATTRSSR